MIRSINFDGVDLLKDSASCVVREIHTVFASDFSNVCFVEMLEFFSENNDGDIAISKFSQWLARLHDVSFWSLLQFIVSPCFKPIGVWYQINARTSHRIPPLGDVFRNVTQKVCPIQKKFRQFNFSELATDILNVGRIRADIDDPNDGSPLFHIADSVD